MFFESKKDIKKEKINKIRLHGRLPLINIYNYNFKFPIQ